MVLTLNGGSSSITFAIDKSPDLLTKILSGDYPRPPGQRREHGSADLRDLLAGGIGEHSIKARAAIYMGLLFLGIEIDSGLNLQSAPIISKGKVAVRVIATDEEIVIATTAFELTDSTGQPVFKN